MLKFANENSQKAQTKMRNQYDKSTTVRKLEPGDKALVLLPTNNNKLLSRWSGPHSVLQKIDDQNNYELLINNRKAILHINSLRKYYADEQDTDSGHTLMVVNEADMELMTFPDMPDTSVAATDRNADLMRLGGDHDTAGGASNPSHRTPSTDVCVGEQLTPEQRTQLRAVLDRYPKVFDDRPGFTHVIEHKSEVMDQTPIYQRPYRIPESQRDAIERELLNMVQLGIIRYDTESSWSSPLV